MIIALILLLVSWCAIVLSGAYMFGTHILGGYGFTTMCAVFFLTSNIQINDTRYGLLPENNFFKVVGQFITVVSLFSFLYFMFIR